MRLRVQGPGERWSSPWSRRATWWRPSTRFWPGLKRADMWKKVRKQKDEGLLLTNSNRGENYETFRKIPDHHGSPLLGRHCLLRCLVQLPISPLRQGVSRSRQLDLSRIHIRGKPWQRDCRDSLLPCRWRGWRSYFCLDVQCLFGLRKRAWSW